MDQYWSWILTAVGILGFYLIGKKLWWAWYINLAGQTLWVAFAIATDQYGFIVAAAFYAVVFGKNAYQWTKDHFAEPDDWPQPRDPATGRFIKTTR